jgi:hypothetical protein
MRGKSGDNNSVLSIYAKETVATIASNRERALQWNLNH